uniref:Transposase Tc1-like domain-containing protein n=1 Tax=Oncorhynchus tshawytscha TaxID=74940 RepID=A0AAZ3RIF1_ONCTS
MGPRSRYTAQEGDAFCLLEMNVQKVQINPRTTAKDLEEIGTKVSISTVKRVLYQHNLKGRSARKKPLLQNRH